jgi:integrase
MARRRQRGEGSVFKRSDGQWVGSLDLGYIDGKRRRKTVYGKTQGEAVKKLSEARRAQAAGHVTTASMTVGKWMPYWLEKIAGARVKPRTLATYRSYSEQYVVPAIGKVRLDRLTAAHVLAVHDKARADGRSETTANHAHWILHSALKDAQKHGKASRNVAELADTPATAASDRRALTLPEVLAVLASVQHDRLASRWLMAFMTGARQGEALGLTWDSVDFAAERIAFDWQLQRVPYRHGCDPACGRRADRCDKRRVDIPARYEWRHLEGNQYLLRPKTKKSRRVIDLPPPLHAALLDRNALYRAEASEYGTDHGLVWPRPDGRPIDGRADYMDWQGRLRLSGIPPLPLHSARHSTATLLDAFGVPQHIVMSILGHSDVTTTRGYTHVDLRQQRAAFDQLGEALRLTT